MPVKRRLTKVRENRITEEAIRLFRKLRVAEDEEWWVIHNQLHKELGMKPHQFPCVADPAEECPYTPPHANIEGWLREHAEDAPGVVMWRELERAAQGKRAERA